MTRFVDVPALARIVCHVGLEQFIAGMAAAVREDFCRWQSFRKSARLADHTALGVIELMPVADPKRYAFKYVNGHPANTKMGQPTVMAFGALADVETGYPTLLAELTLTTAFRTAATSAVAAQALARPESRIMGMIGCGAQSEFQALAFHTLLSVEELRLFDIDKHATAKLASHLSRFSGLRVAAVESATAAVNGADIITTCTADKSRATILTPGMVAPGTHINALGGDCPGKTELHPDVLRNARIIVEYEPQTRVEGDIQQLPPTHPVTELWRVLTGIEYGRDDAVQITVFDSVGFALEDFSALRYVQQLAEELGEGRDIALIPTLSDPKDLFGALHYPGIGARSQDAA